MLKEEKLFSYEVAEDELTVKLIGEIDHHSAVSLRHEVDEMLMKLRPKTLYIDLSAVDFMDSSGLGLIMGRFTLMKKLGGETVIINPSVGAKRILSLAGIKTIKEITN